jgi:hypothetical protein
LIRLRIALDGATAEKMAHALGVELVDDPMNADGVLLFFKNPVGSATDIAGDIVNPKTTVVVAGIPNYESIAFAEEAAKNGVPEQNIIFTATRGITISDIQPLIKSIIVPPETKKKSEPSHSIQPSIQFPREEKKIVKISKVISVVGCKGGVGRTTFAASLVAHYASVSEKAILLDASLPHNGKYHITNATAGDVIEGLANPSEELKVGYRRIVVDVDPAFEDMKTLEKVVVIVDADTVQSLEPTVDIMKREGVKPCVVVYNRTRAEVPKEIVEASFVGVKVIAVEDDFAGCRAALAAGIPASMKSKAIAKAIGEIAAIIDSSS